MSLSADTDGLLSQALLLGELRSAVELCMKEERFADAIILAQAGDAELLKWTQESYLAKRRTKTSSVQNLLGTAVTRERGGAWAWTGEGPSLGTGV